MKLSEHGEKIIKNFEGLRLTAYRDVAGVWTIGLWNKITDPHTGKKVESATLKERRQEERQLFLSADKPLNPIV